MKICQRCKKETENNKNRYCKSCIKLLKKKMEDTGYLQENPQMVVGKNRGRKCLTSQRLSNSEEMQIE